MSWQLNALYLGKNWSVITSVTILRKLNWQWTDNTNKRDKGIGLVDIGV